MHRRVLTGKNLEKRGFMGPFRCPLYAEATKNINHLFLRCPYSISVWEEMTECGGKGIQWPENIQDCFLNWNKMYKGDLVQKKGLTAC